MGLSKLIFSLSAFCLGAFLVLISAFRLSIQTQGEAGVRYIFAQETTGENKEINPEETVQQKEVDYYLPYPGILPDHPLYWLKMIRDRVRLYLTRDPLQKLERLLLYADKRLGAAKILVEGNKPDLGATTAIKGEQYLEQAVGKFNDLKQTDKASPEFDDKFKKAVLKHEEILKKILEKVPDQTKPEIKKALEINQKSFNQ